MENLDGDDNTSFVWGALKQATKEMLTTILEPERVSEAFEAVVIMVATNDLPSQEIVELLVQKKRIMEPIDRLGETRQAWKPVKLHTNL